MRLITRLMFVWFVKEKGLVAEDLFVENQVAKLLRDYDADGGDSYYRAVLQNLFFATLNTEISRRRFSSAEQLHIPRLLTLPIQERDGRPRQPVGTVQANAFHQRRVV